VAARELARVRRRRPPTAGTQLLQRLAQRGVIGRVLAELGPVRVTRLQPHCNGCG
jgi:hypothetical protein